MKIKYLIAYAITLSLLTASPAAIGHQESSSPKGAQDEPPTTTGNHPYTLPNFIQWDHNELVILLIPPAHGSLVSTGEGVLPYGPDGALPTGAYLDATLHVLEDWRYALDQVAVEQEEVSWVADITWDVRVIPQDLVTPQDVQNADIVKFYTETTYPVLGAATNTGNLLFGLGPGCVAFSTMWMTYGSMSYEDMYKVSGHELGHCLGPSHTQGDSDGLDIMNQGGYPQGELRCPSNLNVLAVAAAFTTAVDAPSGPTAGDTVSVDHDDYKRYCSPESDPR